MATPVLMPQAGQSMTEGKIVEWYVKEGATVVRGDELLAIETDKATLEVESPADGVVRKIYYDADAIVAVLSVVAVIGTAEEKIDFEAIRSSSPGGAATSSAAAAKPSAPRSPTRPKPAKRVSSSKPVKPAASVVAPAAPTSAPGTVGAADNGSGGAVRCSPLARRLARIRGIDLASVRGTGPQGRIIKRDVEAGGQGANAPVSAAAGALAVTPQRPYPEPSPRPPAHVPIEGMRRAIATALERSKSEAPHFYLSVEIDVTAALALRSRLATDGLKVSVNDLVVRAAAVALADEPRVNCRVTAESIEYPDEVNIGIAVGLEDGLVVPVVVGAQDRDLAGTAEETQRIIAAAHEGRLVGMGQGTFTISNLGMEGVVSFTAIINPPEGAILAVGAALPRAVPVGGGFLQRSILKATLSADHRAIDGVLAARFMARLRHLLENPERLER